MDHGSHDARGDLLALTKVETCHLRHENLREAMDDRLATGTFGRQLSVNCLEDPTHFECLFGFGQRNVEHGRQGGAERVDSAPVELQESSDQLGSPAAATVTRSQLVSISGTIDEVLDGDRGTVGIISQLVVTGRGQNENIAG